ncbi:hypothetical protein ES332_D02G090700v1 [Gossypium tomentosum]|uniref:Uncharacterized protein n=1 Tax=Gossypium tomentosum TaxID=34277 RepID=A0A5D2LUW9_GOSTO|nr:hypothetical protein ES332_D02G090700v1 [Gossypium tomentosum]
MEQLFLIFISDLCYQQWHQTFNIISLFFSLFFIFPFLFPMKNSSLSFSLFLHINMAADMVKARNENQLV